MVYWFNGLVGFPLGKTKPFLESLVQRLRNTGGGGYPPAHNKIVTHRQSWHKARLPDLKMVVLHPPLTAWVVAKIMIPFWVPHYNRDPRRGHNFDNHPHVLLGLFSKVP